MCTLGVHDCVKKWLGAALLPSLGVVGQFRNLKKGVSVSLQMLFAKVGFSVVFGE